MNERLRVLGVFGGLGLIALAALRLVDRPAEAAPFTIPTYGLPAAADAAAVSVLVELFTSEGCSSCPPADVVLAGLERSQPVAGARIVPLALHVDYWDRLGWTDPFSTPRASERQRAYASLGSGSYTPQAVIDGRAETVGSRRAFIEQAIAEASRRPHAAITVDLAPRATEAAPFEITLRIGALPAGAASDAEAVVALTQNVARVEIKRGENGGSTLEHTAIARELGIAGAVPAAGGTLKATVKPPAGVTAKDLRVVAFVQERASRRVIATATRDAGAAR
ncbi:MAG TPA: DUF1223 domain-containing protein [Labilithrix sp.]|nr:DUF1223 domain-containing protein [Labilithrix sp.]